MSQAAALWQFAARCLEKAPELMLLVVVESSGSSPGRIGFKMIVEPSGELHGSIGGGIMEVKLAELARECLLKNPGAPPFLKRQVHRKDAPRDQSGMICSGEQTVLFFPLKNKDLAAVQTLAHCEGKCLPALLRLSASAFQGLEGQAGQLPQRFRKGEAGDFLFEENLGLVNQLCIVGGGHCALALSEIMAFLGGFRIRVFDDRPGLNTFLENRFAHEKQVLDAYEEVGGQIPEGPNTHVVVMTLGYRSDAVVIRQLLGRSFGYLGLLGSKAKVAVLLKSLEAEGFPADELSALRAPAGLPIGSRTPKEIAVSIAAELISLRS